MPNEVVKLVCFSDSHMLHRELAKTYPMPEGDILLVAGDFTGGGRPHEVESFDSWLATLPYPHKIVVAGNHELTFEAQPDRVVPLLQHATYLLDKEISIRPRKNLKRIRIYGSPWQPRFFDWAFNLPKGGQMLANRWQQIPMGLDVLITHGPPLGILDTVTREGYTDRCGDELLRDAVRLKKPRVHVFGHLHGDATDPGPRVSVIEGTIFGNVAVVDEFYKITRPATVIELSVAVEDAHE